MSRLYECQECHLLQAEPDGLCRPAEAWTPCLNRTVLEDNLRSICSGAVTRVDYFCSGCGRPTADADLLCLPTPLRD